MDIRRKILELQTWMGLESGEWTLDDDPFMRLSYKYLGPVIFYCLVWEMLFVLCIPVIVVVFYTAR